MSSSPILRARRTVSRPLRVAGVFRLGEPAGFLNRLAAALIDCLVVAPFGVVVLLAAVAISRATGGEVQLHPAFGALLLLLVHWTHALVLEGGPRGGTLGKQFLGLQVCDGESGEVAGHGPALARHLCLELWCLGSVCASFLLTARRQTGHFESLDVYESIDWMVVRRLCACVRRASLRLSRDGGCSAVAARPYRRHGRRQSGHPHRSHRAAAGARTGCRRCGSSPG